MPSPSSTKARRASWIAAAALAAAAHAAPAATDLLAAWESAQGHDPAYAAARAEWQAGLARERQGQALLRPQVALTGSAGYVVIDNDTRGAQFSAPGFGASNEASFRTRIDGGTSASWAVSAQQPIYNVDRQASAGQLERQARLAEAQLRAAEHDLILRTAQAYFAVILAEETLATLRAQKNAAARSLEVAKEKFEAGATPVTDRDEAQARYDEIRTREIVAGNDVTMKRTAFFDVTGKPAEGLSRASGDARRIDSRAIRNLAEWKDAAIRDNPLLAMQALGVDIARHEVTKYRALLSPTLDLVARIADDRMHGSSGYGPTARIDSGTRLVALQLTIPLYTGGMRSAKRDEAAALAEKARHEAQNVRQELLRHAEAAWLAVNTGIERVMAHEQALKSARSRLNATETGQEVGARTMLDFMNAQSDYYQAQRDLLQTRYQLLLDRLRLFAVAGTLGEAELREVNAALEPAPRR
jgi:outer membrane protein